MNLARFAYALAGLAAEWALDLWHPPGVVTGYDSMEFYADNT